VKIMLFNGQGELLLIRNNYGDTSAFVLPGGGVGRREEPIAAAARELREETGITGARLRLLGEYESLGEGKRDRVSLFHGSSDAQPRADGVEVVEAGYLALGALPETTSAATRKRICQWVSGGPYCGPW
jgi:8-oxo-dGTP pyrophosphatase MutT (NUDIX family)